MMILASVASGQTALVWDSNTCADVAFSRSDVRAFLLPRNVGDTPDLRAWRETGYPRPRPGTLVDLATGLSEPVTGLADVDAALATLAARVADYRIDRPAVDDDGNSTTWREVRKEYRDARTEYDDKRAVTTNRLASTNWGNTQQVARVFGNMQDEIEKLKNMIDAQWRAAGYLKESK